MTLPEFKYHPDPVATGSIVASAAECICCNQARGHIYIGPVYAANDYDEQICPWCIADGSAHEKLNVHFTDTESVGGAMFDEVDDEIVAEVAYRTPGFSGWQQEQWGTHCDDAAEFIGSAGCKELEELGPAAITAIQQSVALLDGPEWEEFFAALDKEGSPRAYLFRCRNCGELDGYTDCN